MTDKLEIRADPGRSESKQTGLNEAGEAAWVLKDPVSSPDQQSTDRSSQSTASLAGQGQGQGQTQESEPHRTDTLSRALLGEEEETSSSSAIDIKRLLLGIWERKLLVSLVASAITALFILAAVTLVDKTWTSRALLLKRVDIDKFSIGDGASFSQQNYSTETILGMLKLPSVLEETLYLSGISADIGSFGSLVNLSRGKNSNLMTLSVTWSDPEIATRLANNLIASFLKSNRALRRDEAEKIYVYYGQQLKSVEQETARLDEKIQEFQRANNVINFDRQTEAMLRQVSSLEIEYATITAELGEIRRNEEALRGRIVETPEMSISSTLYKNPLKTKLNEMKWALDQLRSRYTDDNPKVIELLQQVAQLEREVAEGGELDTPEHTYSVNPVRQALIMKQLEDEQSMGIKAALAKAVGEQLSSSRVELAALTDAQQVYEGLVSARNSQDLLLSNLRNRVEEARIIMESNQSDFEIVEPAKLPVDANPTLKKVIAVAGFVLGGGLGLFAALLAEFFDPKIRTRKEIEAISGCDRIYELQTFFRDMKERIEEQDADSDLALVTRRIVNDMNFTGQESPKVVPICSLERSTFKSSLANNFSQTLAFQEHPSVLIDADLSPSKGVSCITNERSYTGILDFLKGDLEAKAMINRGANRLRYFVVSSGDPTQIDRASVLKLSSIKMQNIMKKFSRGSLSCFVDLPPLKGNESVFELIRGIGSAFIVVRSNQTLKRDFKELVDRFERSDVKILGILITDVPAVLSTDPQQYVPS